MPGTDMKAEFNRWSGIMVANKIAQATKKPLTAPLIEFFDESSFAMGLD
jgi:hypothetical protein